MGKGKIEVKKHVWVYFIFAFFVMWVFSLCTLRPVSTSGPSMYPTIQDGDHIVEVRDYDITGVEPTRINYDSKGKAYYVRAEYDLIRVG